MRRLFVPAALIAVLALAGCSAPAESAPSATSTAETSVTVTYTEIENAETAEQAIDWVLNQEPNSMTGDEVADAASKLNDLAAGEYSNDAYATIRLELSTLTLDAIGMHDAEFQIRLTQLAEQIRDLG